MNYYAVEYCGESCGRWVNLGDDIQTIAVSKLLPKVDGYISRESLDKATECGVIPLNGYFGLDHWPIASGLTPIFFSFHISVHAEKIICSPEGVTYMKAHGPIGCRDRGTMDILAKYGVEAYYSKCLSLTFERRQEHVPDGKIYLVGVSSACQSIIPPPIHKKAIKVDQSKLRIPLVPSLVRFGLAQHLLETYKRTASLVITSKIHCAMPCIAMGIPVVFLYDGNKVNEYRVKIINDLIGINYVPTSPLSRNLINLFRSEQINWNPEPLDLEEEKRTIKARFLEALHFAEVRHQTAYPN